MEQIWGALNRVGFKVTTDTRKDVAGSVFFCLKGDNFDANDFVQEALDKEATAVVTEDVRFSNTDKVFVVEDCLKVLQTLARRYRDCFDIPIIVVGGSNGKTTTREIIKEVLSKKYSVHSSLGNLNNHIGVPLSIFAMPKSAEIAVFEVGANHSGEHSLLLDIIAPTHVTVTNNGLDHLEGFLTPEGVRMANAEIFDWAREHKKVAFVNEDKPDLMEDSLDLERALYSTRYLSVANSYPLAFSWSGRTWQTNLFGEYNLDNIALAVEVGKFFGIREEDALEIVSRYSPGDKRSQIMERGDTTFIVDCYNANPTSMSLALESFSSSERPRGLILGDMLELGSYADEEHIKIVKQVEELKPDLAVFIGKYFKDALGGTSIDYQWFPNSEEARQWLSKQDVSGYTILLKGSRGVQVERVIL